MKRNPFDLQQDKEGYSDRIDPKEYSEEREYADARKVHRATQKAIVYVEAQDERILAEAIKKVDVHEVIERAGQYGSSALRGKIAESGNALKKERGIVSPNTLEEVLRLVERFLPQKITLDNYEEEYDWLGQHTYAHYLRLIAKEAWNLKHKRKR